MSADSQKAFYTKQREDAEAGAAKGDRGAALNAAKIYYKNKNNEEGTNYAIEAKFGKGVSDVNRGINKIGDFEHKAIPFVVPEARGEAAAGSIAESVGGALKNVAGKAMDAVKKYVPRIGGAAEKAVPKFEHGSAGQALKAKAKPTGSAKASYPAKTEAGKLSKVTKSGKTFSTASPKAKPEFKYGSKAEAEGAKKAAGAKNTKATDAKSLYSKDTAVYRKGMKPKGYKSASEAKASHAGRARKDKVKLPKQPDPEEGTKVTRRGS
jgi:hypothetical protein